jgi:N utilization substance protein B
LKAANIATRRRNSFAISSKVVREQRRLDPLVDRHLAEGWRLNRVDSILRAILRAGI